MPINSMDCNTLLSGAHALLTNFVASAMRNALKNQSSLPQGRPALLQSCANSLTF
jgi:hypothetical protein